MAPPTLLLTRPRDAALGFAAMLDPAILARVHVVIAPLMEIAGIGAVPRLEGVQGVIFTSVNGVVHAPDGVGRMAFCVGAHTTQKAADHGWNAQQMGDTAQDLIASLRVDAPATPLLHLAGRHTRGDVALTLTAAGIPTDYIALYEQKFLPLDDCAAETLNGPCIVPVFSPRSGQQLVAEAKGNLENAHIIAFSGAVAEAFPHEKCAQLVVISVPRALYMCRAVENLCQTLCLP
jgi:uroporphyrinogen-III synthase